MDVTIHTDKNRPKPNAVTGIIDGISQITPSVKLFKVNVGKDFHFLPGQWADVFLPIEHGTEQLTGFSMINNPASTIQNGELEFAIKLIGNHPVTNWIFNDAKIGDKFKICGGQGKFYFEKSLLSDRCRSVVLLAGGIGVTPFLSMLHYVDKECNGVSLLLVYSAQQEAEFLFKDELVDICNRNKHIKVVFTVSGHKPKAEFVRHGRITSSLLQEVLPKEQSLFYISGPSPMIINTAAVLKEMNIADNLVHYELWS